MNVKNFLTWIIQYKLQILMKNLQIKVALYKIKDKKTKKMKVKKYKKKKIPLKYRIKNHNFK